MQGLELSRLYFEECGRDVFQKNFPEIFPRMAFGLAGEGSDCFSFDDEISRDHDWGAGFCIWLDEPDYTIHGQKIQAVYDALPQQFHGYPVKKADGAAGGRIGVLCTQHWYQRYTGCPAGPETLTQWRAVPEYFLAAVTNGDVFLDMQGHFSSIRSRLLLYYPEDVRRKKIAYQAAVMAQAGQYNYPRCAKRGDMTAAALALWRFLEAGMSMVYLLNKRYAPLYKWMHRGMEKLSILKAGSALFERLADNGGADEKTALIEQICGLVGAELRRQGLSDCQDTFLLSHCADIMHRITDPVLRQSHIMAP